MPQYKRRYALFYQVGKRHFRVSESTYVKETAVRVFQDMLLNGLKWRASLRPALDTPVWHVVTGAFGRTYTTAAAAIVDWESGKDFYMLGGRYCSCRDNINVLIRLNDTQLTLVPMEARKCDTSHTTTPKVTSSITPALTVPGTTPS